MLTLLARNARKSIPALIRNYHLGWRIVLALALLNIILLVPLLAYAFFEATTMATGQIFVGVLIMLLIAGAAGVWHTVKILPRFLSTSSKVQRHISHPRPPRLGRPSRLSPTAPLRTWI
jgi:hypothetical protein